MGPACPIPTCCSTAHAAQLGHHGKIHAAHQKPTSLSGEGRMTLFTCPVATACFGCLHVPDSTMQPADSPTICLSTVWCLCLTYLLLSWPQLEVLPIWTPTYIGVRMGCTQGALARIAILPTHLVGFPTKPSSTWL